MEVHHTITEVHYYIKEVHYYIMGMHYYTKKVMLTSFHCCIALQNFPGPWMTMDMISQQDEEIQFV